MLRSAGATFATTAVLAVSSASCGGEPVDRENPDQRIKLSDIGITAEFGVREQADRLALLHRVVDAAFMGEEVVILDQSPPWVRVFDREGNFLRYLVRRGRGPGEATRPSSLAATQDGFLLVDGLGLSHLSRDGELIWFRRREHFAIRGAVEACGRGMVILTEEFELPSTPRRLVQTTATGVIVDTLEKLGAPRPSSRSHHSWFVAVDENQIVFYPEERDVDRLVVMACDGSRRSLVVDSLGPGVVQELQSERFMKVSPPKPPFPAGVALTGNHILWAANVVQAGDSLTTITAFGRNNEARRVFLDGWVQILDSHPDGALLLGNSFLYGRSYGLFPRVLLVNGETLLSVINERGVVVR